MVLILPSSTHPLLGLNDESKLRIIWISVIFKPQRMLMLMIWGFQVHSKCCFTQTPSLRALSLGCYKVHLGTHRTALISPDLQ